MRREDVFKALETILEAVPGVRTFGRRLVPWADVPPSDQPALYMLCANQTVTVEGRGIPPKRSLPVTLYLYNQNDDPAQQNDLLDAIEAALEPRGEETLTLGGLVSHCRIEGEIETDEGLLDSQAVAIVPVSILVP
jgi:hypothetical protein